MTSFKLTAGGVEYTLGTDGGVAAAGAPAGKWTTDGKSTNKVVVTKPDNTTVAIDVVWSFNPSNQLCVAQGANPAFNFTVASVHPLFRMDSGNKLHVTPSPGGSLFEFVLVCGFALTADASLEITINGQKSTITGVPASNKAYFGYSFRDKAAPIPSTMLAFTGQWVRDATNPNQIDLVFKFTVDANAFQFAMPAGSTTAVSQQNQLIVTGVKNGQGWGVSIAGALEVRKDHQDFSLVFTLSDQHTADGVKTTTLEVKAVFAPDDSSRLSGFLDLYVGVTKTAASKRVTVKGDGHVALGDAGLDITFACASTSGGGQPAVVALMVAATFTWNADHLTISYKKDGASTTVELASEFVLKSQLRLQAYLNVTKAPGQNAGVYGALGLSW
jgi:hypothetical protein